MKALLGFFTRSKKQHNERTDMVRKVDDMQFKILSNTIQLSEREVDMIIKIVHEELTEVTRYTGYVIAQRISKEVNAKKIYTAHVNGGDDGKEWLIQVSNNPHEYID